MIRELQWKDMEDLVDNYYSYYDEVETDNPELGIIFYHQKPSHESEAAWFTSLYRDVLNDNAIAMVAEVDGKVVGICDIRRERPGSEVSHKGVLGIAIRKGYRGKGIGSELVSSALEKARSKYDVILLGVFSTNKNAIKLYRKIGFVEYGKLPASVKRNGTYFDEIQMYYPLK